MVLYEFEDHRNELKVHVTNQRETTARLRITRSRSRRRYVGQGGKAHHSGTANRGYRRDFAMLGEGRRDISARSIIAKKRTATWTLRVAAHLAESKRRRQQCKKQSVPTMPGYRSCHKYLR